MSGCWKFNYVLIEIQLCVNGNYVLIIKYVLIKNQLLMYTLKTDLKY